MSVLLLPADTPREAWLAERRSGIGASEIAGVLGVSPWVSAFALYWRKVGVLDDDVDTERLEWGRRLEEPIARKFAEDHDWLDVRPSGLYRSTARPWQLATPDRELTELGDGPLVSVLECKSDNSWDGWGDAGTDEVPVYYRAQVLWQMDVLGLDVAYVACLFGGRTYREYVIERDEADLQVMRAAGEAFWRRVQDGEPPDLDGHDATAAVLKALHPDLEDVDVEVPHALAERYRLACRMHKEAAETKAQLDNELRGFIGNGRRAVHDGEKLATRSVYDRKAVDLDRLRADHPDLVREYTTTSTVQKLVPASTRNSKPKTIREAVHA